MKNAALLIPLALLAAPAPGCVNLDFTGHNPIHCSRVSSDTCDGPEGSWNLICAPCDEAYDFGRSFEWQAGTLAPGESVRPIPEEAVNQLTLETDDGLGALDTYFIQSHGKNAQTANVTLIYNHGNFASIEHYIPRLQFLYEGGYNILVWDYRGYGKSQPASSPTGEQWEADALQIRALADTLAPDPDQIVAYGYSLGAIPAVDMARVDPGMALLLEAPFTSIEQIAEANAGLSFPGSIISTGHYENTEEIKDYAGPLLVMGGDEDQLFSAEDFTSIYDAAPGNPKALWLLPGVGHGIGGGGVPEAGLSAYLTQMAALLEEAR